MDKKTSASRLFCFSLVAALACSNFAGMSAFAADTTEQKLPSSFDLRDVDGLNFVTPVKNQGLGGTCWAYAAISAAETSIMYENWKVNGVLPQDEVLDLSELQAAWFAYHPIPEDDPSGQGTEGIFSDDWADIGGYSLLASSLFLSNIGPIDDSVLPFMSKSENILWIKVNEDWTAAECDEDGNPILVLAPIDWEPEEGNWYPAGYNIQGEDFGVTEAQRFLQKYRLERACFLEPTCEYDRDRNFIGYHPEIMEEYKKELLAGRAIVLNFFGDGRIGEDVDSYVSENYAQYTYDFEYSNHAVCVVGYDDNYSRENFCQGETEDGESRTPPGDGAWIIKNSWGSVDSMLPAEYGVDGTGYMYLSYYDHSISGGCTLDFDVTPVDQTASLPPFQYDLLPPIFYNPLVLTAPAKYCNVFESTENYILDSVSTYVPCAPAKVTYEVYRLNPDAKSMDDSVLVSKLEKQYDDYYGFYRETLPEPVAVSAGESFYVAVTVETEDPEEGTIYVVPYGSVMSDTYYEYVNEHIPEEFQQVPLDANAVVKQGESLIYIDSKDAEQKWYSIDDFGEEMSAYKEYDPDNEEFFGSKELAIPEGLIYDNFPVKAFRIYGEDVAVEAELKADRDTYTAGDTVKFTLTLTNPSEQFDLYNVEIKSALSSYDFSSDAMYLPAGESKTITYTYTVTEKDIKAGSIKEVLDITAGKTSNKPYTYSVSATVAAAVSETTEPETTTTTAIETTTTADETTTTNETTTTEALQTAPAENFYSDDELCNMAIVDYQSKNGDKNVTASAEEQDGKVVITLTDSDNNVVDTYMVDPNTGKGTDANGGNVNLPQTGNNSVGTAAAAAASLLLTISGAVLMAKAAYKKEDENA